MTFSFQQTRSSPARASATARTARHAQATRLRARCHAPAMRLALACLAGLGAVDAQAAHKARPPKAASAPTTAQILAPSSATVPDAIPPDKTIYRCGSTYSPHPCAGGGTAPLDVADTRSEAQRQQSQDVAARDKRLAAWYEAGRHQREAAASAPARAASTVAGCVPRKGRPCPPAAKDRFAPHMQRIAVVPGSAKPKD